MLVAFIVESYAVYCAELRIPNLWLYDLYVPVEFTLLLGYVHGQLTQPWQRRSILPAWLILAVACALDLHAKYPEGFVSGAYITGSLVLVAAFLALLYDLALRVDVALHRQPLFWAHLGMALFFSGMVPLLGLWNKLVQENAHLAADLYTANHALFALRYGGILIACVVAGRLSSPGNP